MRFAITQEEAHVSNERLSARRFGSVIWTCIDFLGVMPDVMVNVLAGLPAASIVFDMSIEEFGGPKTRESTKKMST